MTDTKRPIRSFVLRQGRMSRAQRLARETLMSRFGVTYANQLLGYPTLFGRNAPVVLEIGCGMGETTVRIAQQRPAVDFIAIEVHPPGVGSLLKHISDMALTNVRVIQHDAVEVVRDMIAPDSLHAVHVFFPDPWPKKRHHKRRLLQPGFVHELAQRLQIGGFIHVATDWEEYATQILETLTAEALLRNTADGFAPRPAYRPQTKFETRGLNLGHDVWDIIFERRQAA